MKTKQILIGLVMLINLSACNDDESINNNNNNSNNKLALDQQYTMLTNIGETAGVQGNSYLQTIEEFNLNETITNGNAIENDNKGTIATYDNQVFFAPFFSTEIKKYTINDDGSLTFEQELAIPFISDIAIVNATKGYILQNNFELKEFNPSTFEITSSISLQEFNTKRETYPFSRAGEMFIRPSDSKIFIALNYIENMTFQNIENQVSIAVVDGLSNTVETILTDDRTYSPGMLIGSAGRGFSMDDYGDIYITCSAGYGFQGKPSKPAGIIRINSGTTKIDGNYFFNFNDAGVDTCVGLHCVSGGYAYTFKRNLDAISNDFSDVTSAAAHNPIKIDLSTNELIGEVEGYTTTAFLNGIWMKESSTDDVIYLPANNSTENAVYQLDINTNSAEKIYNTTGPVVSFEPLNP